MVESQPESEPEPVVKSEEENLGWLTPEQKKRLDLVDFASKNIDGL